MNREKCSNTWEWKKNIHPSALKDMGDYIEALGR